MLAQAHTRTTATHEQKSAKLLISYPEQIAATLTPRQLRATLSGQQYYLDHQNGKHLSHTDLSAWRERKSKQWQRAHTSIEWQTYFMSGWYAALLSDPTAEKEHIKVTTIRAVSQGDKAGEPTAQIARPMFGRDDDEERRPSSDPEDYEDFGWSLKHFPLWGQHGGSFNPSSELKTLKNGATRLSFPLWGQHRGTFNSLAETLLFGTLGGGRPGWSLIKYNAKGPLFGGEDGDDGGWSLLFGPKDHGGSGFRLLFALNFGGALGWWIAAPHDGNDDSWGDRAPLPLFGPEDGDETGWSILNPLRFGTQGKSLSRASLASLDPTCDARVYFAPDDEAEERCPSFGEEGEDGGYRPHTRPSFLCIDDDDEDRSPRFGDEGDERGGWYRSRLPHYLARKCGGGATLLHVPSMGARSRPIMPTEPADGDGDERCPCFPLGARPAGRPIWPDDDDGNAYYPRSLTRQEGTRWQ